MWTNRRGALFFLCRRLRPSRPPLLSRGYSGPCPGRRACCLVLRRSFFSVDRASPFAISSFPTGCLRGFPVSLSLSLFVPIIFPGYGDLWGSYGWGLPTLSDVKFQLGFVGLVLDNHCVPCSYGLSFLPYAWWPVFFC